MTRPPDYLLDLDHATDADRIVGPHAAVNELVDSMLFVGEAPLDDVSGTSGFAERFTARGPRDSKGRSLREFDLKTRLFKYPCSYLIYSEAFDALPKEMKEKIYGRLWEILSGKDTSEHYAKLTPDTRQAIAEILAATKRGLPQEWTARHAKL